MRAYKFCFLLLVIYLLVNSKILAQFSPKIRLESKVSLTRSSPNILFKGILSSSDIRVYQSSNDQTEVSIAINQANLNNLLIGANTTGGQGYYYSADGGNNWLGSDVLPGVDSISADPAVVFDASGNAYFNFLERIGSSWYLKIKKSTDGGSNWLSSVQIPNAGDPDKNYTVVDITNSPYKNYRTTPLLSTKICIYN
ncbi:hypothetical protein HYV10_01595 [Candidatus Dependentiae bacterium]|nr:hypothetical protein [Candidatus Dependentiae bacterium]